MNRLQVVRYGGFALSLASVALACGCGSGGTHVPPPQPVAVSVTPRNASVVVATQPQQFSAKVTGDPNNLGVTWSVDLIAGGNAAVGTISSLGLYTPPAVAGAHTVTATAVADTSKSAAASVGVTDLSGVFTYHNNLARDGVNSQEYALTTTNVNPSTFGKLFSCPVDGVIYVEPLWVAALNVSGSVHNVVFVATAHDSLYAFDADTGPCQQIWRADLLDALHGGTANESSVCANDVGQGFGDIQPEVGITGTPVVDPGTGTLYVVSKSENGGCSTGVQPSVHQRLHAIDVASGSEKLNGPVTITASVPGTGDGSSAGVLQFNARSEGQRPGLTLLKGVAVNGSLHDLVYISWASHEDAFPYHGWVIGYDAANVQQQREVFNTTPDGGLGGIWMAGAALAADAGNNLYFATGNGTFDADTGGNDLGDTVARLATSGALGLTDYFTPFNQASLNQVDADLGSGGVVLLPDQATGLPHLLIQAGKQGLVYVINRDNMGQFTVGTDNIVQEFQADNGSWTTPAFWQNTLYLAGSGDHGNCDSLHAYSFDSLSSSFTTTSGSDSTHCFGFPGASPVVSSSGGSNGIVWAIDSGCYTTAASPCAGPAILFAFDATNLSNKLWDSSQAAAARDQAGAAVKFTLPTVANGRVYIGTRTELDVYGLLP